MYLCSLVSLIKVITALSTVTAGRAAIETLKTNLAWGLLIVALLNIINTFLPKERDEEGVAINTVNKSYNYFTAAMFCLASLIPLLFTVIVSAGWSAFQDERGVFANSVARRAFATLIPAQLHDEASERKQRSKVVTRVMKVTFSVGAVLWITGLIAVASVPKEKTDTGVDTVSRSSEIAVTTVFMLGLLCCALPGAVHLVARKYHHGAGLFKHPCVRSTVATLCPALRDLEGALPAERAHLLPTSATLAQPNAEGVYEITAGQPVTIAAATASSARRP